MSIEQGNQRVNQRNMGHYQDFRADPILLGEFLESIVEDDNSVLTPLLYLGNSSAGNFECFFVNL